MQRLVGMYGKLADDGYLISNTIKFHMCPVYILNIKQWEPILLYRSRGHQITLFLPIKLFIRSDHPHDL